MDANGNCPVNGPLSILVAGFARIRAMCGMPEVWRPCLYPHLSAISEMPRATLCGLSSRFAVREVVLLRLLCPGSSGGIAARRAWAERSCLDVVANEKHAFLPHKVAGDEQRCRRTQQTDNSRARSRLYFLAEPTALVAGSSTSRFVQ